jgi:hypothetical protein
MKEMPIPHLLLSFALLLSGCASAPLADKSVDALAKSFVAEPNKANIYVSRPVIKGGAVLVDVFLDGKKAGVLARHMFVRLVVPQGRHVIGVGTRFGAYEMPVATQAGMNYFLHVKFFQWKGRPTIELSELDAGKGKRIVSGAKLAQKWIGD